MIFLGSCTTFLTAHKETAHNGCELRNLSHAVEQQPMLR
jgi:hypothetical protein